MKADTPFGLEGMLWDRARRERGVTMKTMQSMKSMGARPNRVRPPSQVQNTPGKSMEGYSVSVNGNIAQVTNPVGKTYEVDLVNQTCTCDAGRYGKNCKHLFIADWHVGVG